MTTTAPTTAPPVDSRVIALAHYAARGVLESVLTRYGITFQESVTLRPVVVADGPVEREGLVGQIVDALKVDAADVHDTVEALIARQLVAAEGSKVLATEAGRGLYTATSAETGKIAARIYDGIPAADLATAGRVLALVNERANAELAALTQQRGK